MGIKPISFHRPRPRSPQGLGHPDNLQRARDRLAGETRHRLHRGAGRRGRPQAAADRWARRTGMIRPRSRRADPSLHEKTGTTTWRRGPCRRSQSSRTRTTGRASAPFGARCKRPCWRALGVKGCVTNGSFRDIDMLAPGFQIVGGRIGPSHAHVHMTADEVRREHFRDACAPRRRHPRRRAWRGRHPGGGRARAARRRSTS